jgi:hypothetical protein
LSGFRPKLGRILCERDAQRLDRWIARAAISSTIAEVLASD